MSPNNTTNMCYPSGVAEAILTVWLTGYIRLPNGLPQPTSDSAYTITPPVLPFDDEQGRTWATL